MQQGDPLGPLIHAAAMHLAVLRLADAHPTAVVRAVHDDVVVVAALADLPAVLTTAAAAGTAVDAELAPAKCAGVVPRRRARPRRLAGPVERRGCSAVFYPSRNG